MKGFQLKKSLPYLKCVLLLSCVVQGPICGRFMGFYVNGFLSICDPPQEFDAKGESTLTTRLHDTLGVP